MSMITYETVNKLLDKITSNITSYPNCVIGILNGGRYPAEYIASKINKPIHFVKISTYKQSHKSGSIGISIPKSTHKAIEKSQIIWIADDIYDTGFTMKVVDSILYAINENIEVKRFTLYSKIPTNFVIYGEITDEWLTFPWEI